METSPRRPRGSGSTTALDGCSSIERSTNHVAPEGLLYCFQLLIAIGGLAHLALGGEPKRSDRHCGMVPDLSNNGK